MKPVIPLIVILGMVLAFTGGSLRATLLSAVVLVPLWGLAQVMKLADRAGEKWDDNK
tara:strand:+ start:8619 stop:8789 length:171 start_codon:yes stop_codon:yes gene_type:complete